MTFTVTHIAIDESSIGRSSTDCCFAPPRADRFSIRMVVVSPCVSPHRNAQLITVEILRLRFAQWPSNRHPTDLRANKTKKSNLKTLVVKPDCVPCSGRASYLNKVKTIAGKSIQRKGSDQKYNEHCF